MKAYSKLHHHSWIITKTFQDKSHDIIFRYVVLEVLIIRILFLDQNLKVMEKSSRSFGVITYYYYYDTYFDNKKLNAYIIYITRLYNKTKCVLWNGHFDGIFHLNTKMYKSYFHHIYTVHYSTYTVLGLKQQM